ncbi:hypothetical protein NDA11_004855 [Ustilago hordei]|uniref:Conserved uncharacterized protein n=1 Tax=Ustilago hordei TaxID=120017 RepID=I2FS13_USTHO|nr:uncharacterized protein UHO2_07355 [Ustilago hordei]KAJ1045115.1 hypothetical protein NDA10_004038 [Ustilago hordei]KAJ1572212.1 hypothetical protein NDA15_007374 [Ustilago hordei]KAJ1573539.1 hypothetical protein NDA11_004855 [Ustilago hordei]KAJ1594369.1 hypothetical protein NDA12_001239 [Ustilago hordei]KAJ1598241.1 hypothetical protein NDA14_001580 [Ustilago hordei]
MHPFLEEISQVQDRSKFLHLWIRGLKEESTYPCLDDLRIRDKISALFQEVALSAEYEEDNRMLLPLWNAGVHPEEQERINEGQPAVVDWPPHTDQSPSMTLCSPWNWILFSLSRGLQWKVAITVSIECFLPVCFRHASR